MSKFKKYLEAVQNEDMLDVDVGKGVGLDIKMLNFKLIYSGDKAKSNITFQLPVDKLGAAFTTKPVKKIAVLTFTQAVLNIMEAKTKNNGQDLDFSSLLNKRIVVVENPELNIDQNDKVTINPKYLYNK